MPKLNPEKLTSDLLEEAGWQVANVVKWVRGSRRPTTKDLWGFGDLLAVCEEYEGATIFQATSAGNCSTRRKKILNEPQAKRWLLCSNRIELFCWKDKDTVKKEEITLEDFK
jgi:hypothetical protein